MSKELPAIRRQVDTDVYETVDGERISVRKYEAMKVKLEQERIDAATTRPDGSHPVRNEADEKVFNEDGTGLAPEQHVSATVPGEEGHLVANPDAAGEGEVGDVRVQTESTPAARVDRTGVSVEDSEPEAEEAQPEEEKTEETAPAEETSKEEAPAKPQRPRTSVKQVKAAAKN